MTKPQFVERWKLQLAGLALYGQATDGLPALQKAERALKIPEQVERLLAEMYDSLPAQPAVNGKLESGKRPF